MDRMVKKRIPLPSGETLEVDVTDKFLEIVRRHFNVSTIENVSNDQIRMYVWGAFKNAVDKAERGE